MKLMRMEMERGRGGARPRRRRGEEAHSSHSSQSPVPVVCEADSAKHGLGAVCLAIGRLSTCGLISDVDSKKFSFVVNSYWNCTGGGGGRGGGAGGNSDVSRGT